MNVITTTGIYRRGKAFPEGHRFTDLSDDECRYLIDLGVAKRATRTIEVADDEPAEAPVKKPAKAAAEKTPREPQKTEETQEPAEAPAVSKDMTRDALDAIAEAEGMSELEQYETKGALVQAIKDHRSAIGEAPVNG